MPNVNSLEILKTIDPDTAGLLRYLNDGRAHTTRQLATASGARIDRVRNCLLVAQTAELVTCDRHDVWGLTQLGKTSLLPDGPESGK